MDCGHELHLPPNALFQGKHGVKGDIGQIQVFVAVFGSRCWADDYAVKGCALLRSFIDHPVGLLPGEFAIIAKKGACYPFALPVSAVLNVADGGLCPSPIPFSSFDVVSFYDCHYSERPPSMFFVVPLSL